MDETRVDAGRLTALGTATLLFALLWAFTYSMYADMHATTAWAFYGGIDRPWWWPMLLGTLGYGVVVYATLRPRA